MKYLFLIFAFVLFSNLETKAQTILTFAGSDTIVNTATVNTTLTVRGKYETAAFQVINTKLSGTAAGTTYLQASVDGVNYVTIDSLVNTNVTTNTAIFTESPPKYPYYRFTTTGSGTMAVITSGKAHFK
jgi:hypothetical protein